jgi:hypothetical protein
VDRGRRPRNEHGDDQHEERESPMGHRLPRMVPNSPEVSTIPRGITAAQPLRSIRSRLRRRSWARIALAQVGRAFRVPLSL